MNRIVIVEDEIPARKRICKLVKALSTENEIVAELDSVEDAIQWFSANPMPDLGFFDIQLADGLSFNIFKKSIITCPIIFTTAFDEYAIRAFKVNSIDYLLKPIEEPELDRAWKKYKTLTRGEHPNYTLILQQLNEIKIAAEFKTRFLIKVGNQYKYVPIEQVQYFYSQESKTFLVDNLRKSYIINEGIDELSKTIDPKYFFRINRKYMVSDRCISKISAYFNGRLILEVSPSSVEPVIVARDRVNDFKMWLDA